jgi:ribosomal protein S18 acetylase RimI-like enzyme
MHFSVTPYAEEDAQEVWDLHCHTINGDAGYVQNLSFHTDMKDIPKVYECFFVMRSGGEIIGMVGLKRLERQSLLAKRLQIAHEHRGYGLAKELMSHVEAYAGSCGVKRISLDVSAAHVVAKNLYVKLGYQITKVCEETFGPDNEKFLMTYMSKAL